MDIHYECIEAKGYVGNFDNEVEFVLIAVLPMKQLIEAENLIFDEITKEYTKVGR